jgi:hypothetical protein
LIYKIVEEKQLRIKIKMNIEAKIRDILDKIKINVNVSDI